LPDSSPFSFSLPTRIRFGAGELQALPAEVVALGVQRPLFVTDSSLARTSPFRQAVEECRLAGLTVEVWDGVVPNPTDASVHEGRVRYRSAGCDGLVGGDPGLL
jgi:alcohol dehydrogenase class IV